MPTYRGKMVVIMAGYQKDIDRLFKLNEGLRSRFPRSLAFSPWSGAQASEALIRHVEKSGKSISDASGPANAKLREYMDELAALPGWASARDVYNNLYKSLGESRSGRIAHTQRERIAQQAAKTAAGGGVSSKKTGQYDPDLLASGYELADVTAAFKSLISERERLVRSPEGEGSDDDNSLLQALADASRAGGGRSGASGRGSSSRVQKPLGKMKEKESQREAEAPPPVLGDMDGTDDAEDPDIRIR